LNKKNRKVFQRKFFLELDSDVDSHDESDDENENSNKPEVRKIRNQIFFCTNNFL